MTLTPLFLKALGIGVAVAAPVGPMSVLCMRRTLAQGWRQGLAVGAGIAVGDAAYGLVAGLGLAGISAFMLANQKPLHLAAGLLLVWLGLRTWRQATKAGSEAAPSQAPTAGLARTFGGALLLTLTNPMTIVMFAAVLAALAPKGGMSPAGALATVAGVFLGSLAWWCAVVAVVAMFRHAIGSRARAWIDRATGLFLAVFGLVELKRAL